MNAVSLFRNTNMAAVTSYETLFLQGSQNKTKGSKKNVLDETEKRKRKKFPEQSCYCYRLFSFLSFFVVVVLFCLFVFSKSFHFF